jgi:hypothetical protein
VREEIICVIGFDNLRVTRIHQGKGAPGGADVHRLPEAVQHQNLTV